MHQTAAIPANLAPSEAPQINAGALHVAWPDGHRSKYPLEYLKQYATSVARSVFRQDPVPVHWVDGAKVAEAKHLHLTYDALNTDEGMFAALEQLTTRGLLFIREAPNASEGSEDIEALATRFGEVRETFYGRVFDVRTLRQSTNIAYTNLDLGLHMDLL